MNIDIQWDRPNSEALLCRFTGQWTWHECREAMQMVMYMQENAGLPVTCIYDLTGSTLSPRASLNRLNKLLSLSIDPQPARIIVVDKSYRVGTLEAMLKHVTCTMEHVYFEDELRRARRLVVA